MAKETENLKLSLYDPTEDKDVKVKDVINNVLGYANSNTTKIDAKFKGVDDNIQILHDYILDSNGNVIYYSKIEVNALLTQHTKNTLLAAYPVGSLYMSAEATSPASLFGGTWERIKDKFILAAGDTYAAGSTGGEATHAHDVSGDASIGVRSNTTAYRCTGNVLSSKFPNNTYQYTHNPDNTYNSNNEHYSALKCVQVIGVADTRSNMPPYLTAYVWRRIA